MKTKICIGICGKRKKLSEFYFRKDSQTYRNDCKECHKLKNISWREKNSEKIKISSKIYYDEHEEELKQKSKNWRKENPKQNKINIERWIKNNTIYIKEYQKKYRIENKKQINKKRREQYNNDIHFKIRINLTNRIIDSLKNNYKSQNTMKLIGCSIEEFKKYLQSQFTEDMSWDNHGFGDDKWHIDHIKPCALFDLSKESEQRKCFNYTNLQPLWQIDNLKKGARYDS